MGIQSNQLIVVIESGPKDLSVLVDGLHAIGAKNPIKHLGSGQAAQDYFLDPDNFCDGSGNPRAALILLDLQLLDMEGQQLLTILRGLPSLKSIPIIVFSSSANQEAANACYELGANSCIQKPQALDDWVPVFTSIMEYWGQVIVSPQVRLSVVST